MKASAAFVFPLVANAFVVPQAGSDLSGVAARGFGVGSRHVGAAEVDAAVIDRRHESAEDAVFDRRHESDDAAVLDERHESVEVEAQTAKRHAGHANQATKGQTKPKSNKATAQQANTKNVEGKQAKGDKTAAAAKPRVTDSNDAPGIV